MWRYGTHAGCIPVDLVEIVDTTVGVRDVELVCGEGRFVVVEVVVVGIKVVEVVVTVLAGIDVVEGVVVLDQLSFFSSSITKEEQEID